MDDNPIAGASSHGGESRRTALAVLACGLLVPTMDARVSLRSKALDVGLFTSIGQLKISADIELIRTTGHSASGDGAALYRRIVDRDAGAGDDTAYRTQDAAGAWWELAEEVITPQMCGPVGQTDDHATFLAWAAATVEFGRQWLIPEGNYVLDGAESIVLRTGGACQGTLLIPKNNHMCRIVFERDSAGAVISTSDWSLLRRGVRAARARNAVGKRLFVNSSEILVEREGLSDPYYKQEFIRCDGEDGSFSTPLVCTYDDPEAVIVTAYEPSTPIRVSGLRIRRTGGAGGVPTRRGVVACQRDSATFDDLTIVNDNPSQPLSVVVEIGYCADVTLNRPKISGANDVANGLGYGLLFATTIGCSVNSPDISDCREAISGRHNVDLQVHGGRCAYAIDDHWGDRMHIEGTVIECLKGGAAVQYAGNDIVLKNIRQVNGRSLLVIRNDTPSLGGSAIISDSHVHSRGEDGDFYLFSFSSPNGPLRSAADRGDRLTLPDILRIDGGSIDVDAPTVWLAYLAVLRSPHRNWGRVLLSGTWTFKGDSLPMGIILFKDARSQMERATEIRVDGPLDFGRGYAVYVTAADDSHTRAAMVKITGLARGNLRYSPYGVASMTVVGGSLGSIENDDPREAPGRSRSHFSGVKMRGGFVRPTLTGLRFSDCTFTGDYSMFPAPANVEMVRVRADRNANLPAHVRRQAVML